MIHYTALNEKHILGPARDINTSELEDHLIYQHRMNISNLMTKAQLGRAHLLAHAIKAYPELRDLMNLPPEWGH